MSALFTEQVSAKRAFDEACEKLCRTTPCGRCGKALAPDAPMNVTFAGGAMPNDVPTAWAHNECMHRPPRTEERACAICGAKRPVKVTLMDVAGTQELYARFCRACDFELAARKHEAQAKVCREKAAKARAAQAKRGGR